MTVTDFKRLAHGVGGSHTRWQGEPPAHAVFWAETDHGQTTVTAYDVRSRHRGEDVVIDEGAVGPNNTPFASEVDFGDLPPRTQASIKHRAIRHFDEDGFFDDPEV